MSTSPTSRPGISTVTQTGRLDVVQHNRTVHSYPMTSHEIDSLVSAGTINTIGVALASVFSGTCLSFLATLLAVPIADSRTYAFFLTTCEVTGIGALASILFVIVSVRKAYRLVRDIKDDMR